MKAITFLKPNLVDIEMISDSKSKIVIQPLERGFGHSPYAEHAERIITMTCLIPWGIDTSPGIYSTAINGSLSAIAGSGNKLAGSRKS